MSLAHASQDEIHMRHALRLAARALGRVAPNPAVGCVLVTPDGIIAGRGWTAPGGRPHAEPIALARAGAAARGCTAYVSFEPCAHHGKTPPCAEALIAAGIARVVGAITDPDSRVNGKGFAMLEAAGVAVTRGVCADEARALNAGFLSRIERGRPLVTLKIAESADGYAAPPPGRQRWITSEAARLHGHMLRAENDAIMIGIGTALADDPLLTCRLEGLEDRSPVRMVVDDHLQLPLRSQLVRTAKTTPVVIFTVSDTDASELENAGAEVVRIAAGADGRSDLEAVLRACAERGLTRLLVEGGPTLHAALLARGLADIVHRYRAPVALGGGTPSALSDGGGDGAIAFVPIGRMQIGPDLLESFAIKG